MSSAITRRIINTFLASLTAYAKATASPPKLHAKAEGLRD